MYYNEFDGKTYTLVKMAQIENEEGGDVQLVFDTNSEFAGTCLQIPMSSSSPFLSLPFFSLHAV